MTIEQQVLTSLGFSWEPVTRGILLLSVARGSKALTTGESALPQWLPDAEQQEQQRYKPTRREDVWALSNIPLS